jgi:hypothetical protein
MMEEADNDRKKPDENRRSDRGARGRFVRGNKANPSGRPKGARNRATALVEELLAGEAETLTRVLIDKAKAGDSTALSLVFARLCPPRKERTIELAPMPPLDDLVAAHSAVIKAVTGGQLSPQEGRSISELLEGRQRAVELAEIASRIAALEARVAAQAKSATG